MPKTVSLPFEVPLLSSTQGTAAPELAMIGHPTAHLQILNQAVGLICDKKFIGGYTGLEVYVKNSVLFNYNIFEKHDVNFRFTKNYAIPIIKEMLDEGFYVYYSEVDDFYLPNKSWFGEKHMNHDGIICGYDDNDNTLSIAAYNSNWVFSLLRIPQECFTQGLESAISAKTYGIMTAYKIRENTEVELNEKQILKLLTEYLNSNFDIYPINPEGSAQGIIVHNYLAMYIDKLKDGSIPSVRMDWRALRPIWEHKKCMLERIKAVEAKNAWNNTL